MSTTKEDLEYLGIIAARSLKVGSRISWYSLQFTDCFKGKIINITNYGENKLVLKCIADNWKDSFGSNEQTVYLSNITEIISI